MYFLYSLITMIGALLMTPFVLASSVRRKKYLPNVRERLGLKFAAQLSANGSGFSPTIWLHAVSVGEVLAAVPFARCLKQRFPNSRLVVSTTTSTGQVLARERMNFSQAVFYFPFDWNGPVRRAFRAVRPDMLIILETEIWPNLLRHARNSRVPVVFVNGRLSDRSFRGFTRAAKMSGGLLGAFLRRILSDGTLYLAQTQQDASRLIALGAAKDRVMVTGSMKYDLPEPAPNAFVDWLGGELQRSKRSPVLVAGSLIAGEENSILDAFRSIQQEWPRALLILAPRKPERFADAAEIVKHAGWRLLRRSDISIDGLTPGILDDGDQSPQSVLLLDTIGELAALYRLADVVFVGGSLEPPAGGHNPLEPAVCGKVPVFGPSMQNFREIASTLLESGAAIQVNSAAQLSAAWERLLTDSVVRAQMGAAASAIVERNRGATAATLDRVAAVIEQRAPA
jgi:3-deoxy-D-manno-octulosonic-acid transferase